MLMAPVGQESGEAETKKRIKQIKTNNSDCVSARTKEHFEEKTEEYTVKNTQCLPMASGRVCSWLVLR